MATARMYGLGLRKVASGSIVFTTDTIKIALLGSAYVPSDTHEFLSDVVDNEVTGTGYTTGGVALSGKTVTTYNPSSRSVAWDADDPSWTSITVTGVRFAVVYKSTGSAASSPLISYIDFVSDQSAAAENISLVLPSTGIAQFTAL